jgi:hypothetical protein
LSDVCCQITGPSAAITRDVLSPAMLDRKTGEHVDLLFADRAKRMAKTNPQRMLAAVPLTDDERDAVDDGQAALDRLLDRLADVHTPAARRPASSEYQRLRRCFPSSKSGIATCDQKASTSRSPAGGFTFRGNRDIWA